MMYTPQIIDGSLFVDPPPSGKRDIVPCPDHIMRGYRLTQHLGIESVFFNGTSNISTSPSYSFLLDGKLFFSTIDTLIDYLHEASHIITAMPWNRKKLNVGLTAPKADIMGRAETEEVRCCYVQLCMMKTIGLSDALLEEVRKDYSFKCNAALMQRHGWNFLKKQRKDFYNKLKTFDPL